LAKFLPPHKIYVEVFGGAANLLLTKSPSRIEVYNDVNGQLVNLFETIRNHPLLFLEHCQHLLYSRELHQAWANQLEKNFDGSDVDKVEAAVRTAYTITSGFTGDPTKGWAFDRRGAGGGVNRWSTIWHKTGYVSTRLRRVNIDHLDFRKCISYWDTPDTLFYLDPPYYEMTVTAFYGFSEQDHIDLSNILSQVEGKCLLTYDDTPQIRELYKKFNILSISSSLSSQKVDKGCKRSSLRQLAISNYALPEVN